jgi:hypothetical protein
VRPSIIFFFFIQNIVDVRHPIADRDLLGAFFFTFITINTFPSPFIRIHPYIPHIRICPILMHSALVEHLEISGDIDAIGAGHAILALGAWDWGHFQVFIPRLFNDLFTVTVQTADAGIVSADNILFYLVKRIHPA